MSEILLEISDEIVVQASKERFKHRSPDGYIDQVKSLMGRRLATGMGIFRQGFSPSSSPRAFDYGGCFMFLPVYRQAESDSLGINWNEVDPRLFLQDLKEHTVTGTRGSTIDSKWSMSKLEAFGSAMRDYILIGTDEMERNATPQEFDSFASGLLYIAHITASAIETEKLKRSLS